MGSNIIDLISSSPPRAPRPDHLPAATANPATTTNSLRYHGIHLGSDDFRSSDDEGVASFTALEDERNVKRPRLSDHTAAASSAKSHDRQRPASPLKPLQSSRVNAASNSRNLPDNSVEWISSIEADPEYASPLPLSRNTSLKRSITEPILPRSSLVPDSDPFASSPPPPPPPQHRPAAATLAHTKLAQDILSDPFASSSPVRVTARASHTTLTATTATTATTIAREQPSRRPKQTAAAWDPISSSAPCSSAPQPNNRNNNSAQRRPSIISIGDSSANDDDLPAIESFDLSQTLPAYHEYLSTSTATGRKLKSTTTTTTTTNTQKRKVSQPTQERNNTSTGTGTGTGRPRQTVDPSERAAAKAQQQEQKRQEREREKENRQRQRDVAAAIVEVNKAKGNKKVSTKEMVVDIPASLPPTVKVQLETLLDGLDVEYNDYDCSPVPNVVRWRRKINSQFDDESGQWVPMPLRIENEQHALVVMTAEEMLQLAMDEDALDSHIRRLRQQCPGEKLMYLLEGVVAWSRRNRNLRNRQYMAGVRSQNDAGQQQEQQPSTQRRRANNREQQAAPVDDDVMEDAILRLQIEHDVLIHHTAIPLETAQWISVFTQNISTIPYKKQKDEETAGARFCMDSGQVKTGDSVEDTYVRMLQEIFRVTAPIAYGVASEFATVTKLVEGLQERGPNALEQVRKSANKDGAYSDRTIGQAVSKRLYKIFTGTDETSTDV